MYQMKKLIISVFVLILSANVFSFGKLDSFEDKILKHPLVKSYDFDASNDTFGYNFILKLKNGHEIYFRGVKDDLTFNKWSGISHINDVQFSCTDFNPVSNEKRGHGYIRIKDICKATGTNYNDVFSILDNYNEFCRLLNTVPWVWEEDKNAEKLCAEYTNDYYVYLYRYTNEKVNKFIEIPEDKDYSSYGRETI